MSSDSNPNLPKPVNTTSEDRGPSLASTDPQTAEQLSDAVVSCDKPLNDVSLESHTSGELIESFDVGADIAEDSRERNSVLEETRRCNSVSEGAEELGELRNGVTPDVSLSVGNGDEELTGGRDSGSGIEDEGAEGVGELNGAGFERESEEPSGEKARDEVVKELGSRLNLEGGSKDLDSSIETEGMGELNGAVLEEVRRDSGAEVAQELEEAKQSTSVNMGKSDISKLSAELGNVVLGDEVVEELTGRNDLEGGSKNLNTSIEAEAVEESREINGLVFDEISRYSATEVAPELEGQRQWSSINVGRSGVAMPAIDSQDVVEGDSGFGDEDNVVIELRETRDSEGDLMKLSDGVDRRKVVLGRTYSELEVEEAPVSPNSSGYAGERGSSSSGCGGGGSETDEIQESSVNFVVDDQGESALGSPGSFAKSHNDEDDASISWRKRKKHFLILSHSGKPIFSRYGDEHKLAGFSATLQAIISFVENGRDRVKLVRAGNHQVVFLVKGPIYLVCISCTEEPYESLKGQLELLYGQMILILTKSVNKCFERNPKFDMTPLLGGTDVVFSSLIHSFNWNPATFLHAYTCVPLAYATRQAVGDILQEVANSGILFALIMCKHKVVSLAGAEKASLHPNDMLLLSNFVVSSESFRTSEAFSPICLPRYNPFAFLHAYIHYFDEDTYLMMLTTSSDAFYHLKDCRMRIEAVLLKSNVLSEVHKSLMDGGMRIEDFPVDRLPRSRSLSHLGHREGLSDSSERHREPASGFGGTAGLLHFMYRSIYLKQYVSSEFATSVCNFQQQKRLYRAYQNLYLSVHHREIGPHKTHYRRDENFVLLCWVTQEFEFYAAFDPLADKAAAIKVCNRVCQWVKEVETDIFLVGGSSFSW